VTDGSRGTRGVRGSVLQRIAAVPAVDGERCMMRIDSVGTRLVVYLSEDDRSGHHGLHEALLKRARDDGLAGATLWRGIEGYGSAGNLRTSRFPDMGTGLPLVLEFIDAPERIDAFLTVLTTFAPGSMVTRESVKMSRAIPHDGAPLDDPA